MHAKSSRFEITADDTVSVVEFCPWPWASSLIAFGTKLRVSVIRVRFQEEDADIKGMKNEHLREFNNGTTVHSIAWSPETSLSLTPKVLRFATAGKKTIHIFTSDLKADDTVQVLEGHKDYVNSIVFDPERGEYLASVSDDHTCRVWSRDGTVHACFFLLSPGMSVCWHRSEPGKLMVAEKLGTIRFYDMTSLQPTMSVSCNTSSPLLQADWNLTDSLHVGCVTGTDWCTWATDRSSLPLERHTVYSDLATNFRWSRSNPQLLATTGHHGKLVKVFHTGMGQVLLSCNLAVSNGLSWHQKLPVVAVGCDRKIHLWRIDTV